MSRTAVSAVLVALIFVGGWTRDARGGEHVMSPAYLGDAVFVGRGSKTPGWNLRIFGGGVVRELVSPRSDLVTYLAVGGHLGIGSVYYDVGTLSRAVGTWSVGPELRLGIEYSDHSPLRVHVAVSPMWLHVDDRALRDGGGRPGVRIAMGLRVPWLSKRGAAARQLANDQSVHRDFGSASSYMGGEEAIQNMLAALLVLVIPDTIEFTCERAGGVARPGLGVGWSL